MYFRPGIHARDMIMRRAERTQAELLKTWHRTVDLWVTTCTTKTMTINPSTRQSCQWPLLTRAATTINSMISPTLISHLTSRPCQWRLLTRMMTAPATTISSKMSPSRNPLLRETTPPCDWKSILSPNFVSVENRWHDTIMHILRSWRFAGYRSLHWGAKWKSNWNEIIKCKTIRAKNPKKVHALKLMTTDKSGKTS